MMFVSLHWVVSSISKTLLWLHYHWELFLIAPSELNVQFQDMDDTVGLSEYFIFIEQISALNHYSQNNDLI
jgi:hypothetical protein